MKFPCYQTDKFDGEIIRLLNAGAVGLLPSDTIYGLSGRALDEHAVQKIYRLKGRSSDKPFIILVSSLEMLNLLSIEAGEAELVKHYWPGPLSVVFPAPKAPNWLTRGSQTLAVRWPVVKNLCGLIDQVGPLISTSANPAGQAPAVAAIEAKSYFGEQLDFYVDTGELDGPPSTVAKIEGGKLVIIRQGAVKL